MRQVFLVALAMTTWSCKSLRTEPSVSNPSHTLLALVVDDSTRVPLGSTLASIRPAAEPFRNDMNFFPIDTAGVLKVSGLAEGQYGVHLKRLGYFQKDTILTVTVSERRTVIRMVRNPLILR
jgi:hypothetical protein